MLCIKRKIKTIDQTARLTLGTEILYPLTFIELKLEVIVNMVRLLM